MANSFLNATSPQGTFKWWRKIDGAEDFNYKHYQELSNQYEDDLANPGDFPLEQTKEGILAYIEALHRYHGFPSRKLHKQGFFPRRSLDKIVGRMKRNQGFVFRDLEELIEEMYFNAYGPNIGLKDFTKSDTNRRMIQDIVSKDLAERGLKGVFSKYKLFANKPNAWMMFKKSRGMQALKAGFFNFPMVFGIPPLWLPRMKKLSLPTDLVDKLILEGLTDANIELVEKYVRKESGNNLWSLKNRARYEVFRRYYMASMAVFITAWGMYEVYQMDQVIEEENTALQAAMETAGEELDNVYDLQDQGFAMFEGEEDRGFGESFCQAIQSCLEEFKEAGELPSKDSDEYKSCKEFMDPEGHCKRY